LFFHQALKRPGIERNTHAARCKLTKLRPEPGQDARQAAAARCRFVAN
jgi:hypothetical protein